jgi:hypothetical protein
VTGSGRNSHTRHTLPSGVEMNELEIHVDRTFPLGRAADAHRYLE